MNLKLLLLSVSLLCTISVRAADDCSLLQSLQQDKDYFNRLLEEWPRSSVATLPGEHITNGIGLTVNKPKKIVKVLVKNTSWDGDISDFPVIAAAMEELELVSWTTFRKKFQASIAAFKSAIGQQEYALLVPSRGRFKLSPQKSNHYFSGVAVMEEGLRPRRIVKNYQELQGISQVVIVDDGSFSGWQLHDIIKGFLDEAPEPSHLGIHLVIPYVSQMARLRVQLKGSRGTTIQWYQQELIRQANSVDWPNARIVNVDPELHLTIFQHKLPDNISAFPIEVLTEDGDWYSNNILSESPSLFVPEYRKPGAFAFLSDFMDVINGNDHFSSGTAH